MSVRKSNAKKFRKKKPPSRLSRAIRKGWDTAMEKSGLRHTIRRIDALAEWEEPNSLNESMTADVISGIPFIGLRRAIRQIKEYKTKNISTNVFDGVSEFFTVAGSTVAMVFPSNTIIYTKKEYIPEKYQNKIKYI